jgi:uncharacterized membrane protein
MKHLYNPFFLRYVCYFVITFSVIEIVRNSFSSLWLDEFTTIWVIEDGLEEVFTRSFNYQGQSPLYYTIVKTFTWIFGLHEFSIRLPSVISAFISLFIFYKIAKAIFGIPASLISVSLLAINQDFLFQSANARPYSILLTIFLLSIWLLIKWIKDQNVGTLVVLSFSSAILFYLHYLYVSAILYLFIVLLSSKLYKNKLPVLRIMITIGLTCLVFLPAVPHLLSLASKAKFYQFAPKPDIREIVTALLIPEILIYSACFLLTYLFFRIIGKFQIYKNGTLNLNMMPRNALAPIFIMIIFPVAFFLLTWWVSGVSNFVNRYFFWNLPGKALLAGVLFSILNKGGAKFVFLILCVFLSVMTVKESKENWRDAVAEIRNTAGHSSILIYSGLIESQNISWHEKEKYEYFTTPVRYYWPTIQNQVIPLPIYFRSKEQEEYLTQILSNLRIQDEEFYIISRVIGIYNKSSTELLNEKLVHGGFEELKSQNYGWVRLSKWRPIINRSLLEKANGSRHSAASID